MHRMNLDAVTGIFTGIPFDLLILSGILIILAIDSLRSGIGRACAISIALPIVLVLYSLIPKTIALGTIPMLSASPSAEAITFGVLAFGTYLLMRRISLEYIESGTGEPVQALIAGGAATAVFIVVWLQFPAGQEVWQLSDKVTTLFSESYRLFWLLGSYLALAFARG